MAGAGITVVKGAVVDSTVVDGIGAPDRAGAGGSEAGAGITVVGGTMAPGRVGAGAGLAVVVI
jgi:hypothetical protein